MLLKDKNIQAKTFFSLTMICLGLSGALGMIHPTSSFADGMVDGIRGALIGAAIALVYLGARRKVRS